MLKGRAVTAKPSATSAFPKPVLKIRKTIMSNDVVRKDPDGTLRVFDSSCLPCLGDETFLLNDRECGDLNATDPFLRRLTSTIEVARDGRGMQDILSKKGANFLILMCPDPVLLLVRAGILHEESLLKGKLVKGGGGQQVLLVEDEDLTRLGLTNDNILVQVVRGMKQKFVVLKLEP